MNSLIGIIKIHACTIAGNAGGDLNLADWQFSNKPPNLNLQLPVVLHANAKDCHLSAEKDKYTLLLLDE